MQTIIYWDLIVALSSVQIEQAYFNTFFQK